MKSIRYRLGGAPRTLDDCLDLSKRQPPTCVRVELDRTEFAGGPRLFVDFLARFMWEFSGGNTRCEECCGSFDEMDMLSDPERCFARANEQLRWRLGQLRKLGLTVEAESDDFAELMAPAAG